MGSTSANLQPDNSRTSIIIDTALFGRLKNFSKNKDKSVSEVIQAAVERLLDEEEQSRADKMYENLAHLQAKMNQYADDPKYAGMDLDEILYGRNGAWSTNNQEAGE